MSFLWPVRAAAEGGRSCAICFNARQLDEAALLPNARLGGNVQLWERVGDGATTFSY